MYAAKRNKRIGLMYLAPALIFVSAFTAYPLHPDDVALAQQLDAADTTRVRRL